MKFDSLRVAWLTCLILFVYFFLTVDDPYGRNTMRVTSVALLIVSGLIERFDRLEETLEEMIRRRDR